MPERGRLFVISGPAGVGKSEIVKLLLKNHPDVKLSVSCTTRAPRPGEVDGVSYHFVNDARFDEDRAEVLKSIKDGGIYRPSPVRRTSLVFPPHPVGEPADHAFSHHRALCTGF